MAYCDESWCFLIVTALLQGNPVAIQTWYRLDTLISLYPPRSGCHMKKALLQRLALGEIPILRGYFPLTAPGQYEQSQNFDAEMYLSDPRLEAGWNFSPSSVSSGKWTCSIDWASWLNLLILALLALLRSHFDDPPWNVMNMHANNKLNTYGYIWHLYIKQVSFFYIIFFTCPRPPSQCLASRRAWMSRRSNSWRPGHLDFSNSTGSPSKVQVNYIYFLGAKS